MNFKKLLIPCLLFAGTTTLSHAEEQYLHIQTDVDNWKVISLDQADRMTFKNGVMSIADAAGNEIATFKTTDISRMQFNDSKNEVYDYGTGILETTLEDETACFTIDSDSRRFMAHASGSLAVYSVDGRMLVKIDRVTEGGTVDFSALPEGIYLFSFNGNAKKVVLK